MKLFNQEPVAVYVRTAEAPEFQSGVNFYLCRAGGSPDRTESVLARAEDRKVWGRPPSSFLLPLETRKLPVGRYLLFARKPGHREAKLDIAVARFVYEDLEYEHTKKAYRAMFHLRLTDVTETRKTVPVTVRIEALGGGMLDEMEVLLHRDLKKEALWRTARRIRLSSIVETPRKEREGKGPLRLRPGCSMVITLDGFEFRYPAPLPLEEEMGEGDADSGDKAEERDVKNPSGGRRGVR